MRASLALTQGGQQRDHLFLNLGPGILLLLDLLVSHVEGTVVLCTVLLVLG